MERAELKALLRATGCAEESGGCMFLCDPAWSAGERSQVQGAKSAAAREGADVDGWLCIPTGGTSGGVRFARHDEKTLAAAVEGFCAHVGIRKVNAVGVLPAHHVSGLMARMRCAATGGSYVQWSWKQLEAGDWPEQGAGGWFISLVPTQLHRLLGDARQVDRLRRFATIFIGGGPMWPELADRASAAGLPIALSYGMTETAAMIAAQRGGDWSNGDRSCGCAMPHAKIEIVDETGGAVLPPGEVGLVRIEAGSLFRGYWPERRDAASAWVTEDLGFCDADGRLHIVGRRDAVIISGGEKIHPAEVEAVLRGCGEFEDIAVVGVPNGEWGQLAVACHPDGNRALNTKKIDEALLSLAAYKRPKRFVAFAEWPRNAQGKVNRAALRAAASSGLDPR